MSRLQRRFLTLSLGIHQEYTVKYLVVAIIFFISGLTLSPQSMGRRLLDWRLHLLTQGGNFLLFSAVVYAIVNIVVSAHVN